MHLKSLQTLTIRVRSWQLKELIQRLSSTDINTLILDLSFVDTLPKDLFCDWKGKGLERISLLRYSVLYQNFSVFSCLHSLKHLTMDYFATIPTGHSVLSTVLRSLPNSLQALDYSHPFGITDHYRYQYVYCARNNQAPCDLETNDFFPQTVLGTSSKLTNSTPEMETTDFFPQIVSVTSSNVTDFKIEESITTNVHTPEHLLHLSLRQFYGICASTLFLEEAPKYRLISNLHVLDLSFSTSIQCYGWYEMDLKIVINAPPSIQYLDISNIGFTSLPPLKGLDYLRVLNCSYNRLGYYDYGGMGKWTLQKEFFWGIKLLEVLDLSGNMLKTVPSDILEIHSGLYMLQLSNNRIESADLVITIPRNCNLKVLNISSNALAFLNSAFVNEMQTLSSTELTIDLSDNPFLCVCELQPMAQWIQTSRLNIENKLQYQCSIKSDNGAVVVMKLAALEREQLCPMSILKIVLCSIGVTVACSVLAVTGLLKYRVKIKVMLYFLKWKLCRRKYFTDGVYHYVIYNDHSDMDRHYVTQTLKQLIEDDWGLKLFIWDRDSNPGKSTADEIVNGIENCNKVLIIHSEELFDGVCDTALYSALSMDDPDESQPNTAKKEQYVASANIDHVSAKLMCTIPNEWMDFSLLTLMRVIKHKPICVIRIGDIPTKQVARKWYPLLFPNEYLSPVKVIQENSNVFNAKLKMFLQD